MPQKPISNLQSVNSQSSRRWVATVYDQHGSARFPRGRPWWGQVERSSDPAQDPGFICELIPGDHTDPMNSSWSAPWYPDQISNHSGSNTFKIDMKTLKLTWNYGAIIAEDKAATLRYYQAAARIARENGWPAPALNEQPSFQIQSLLMDPPRSYKVAEAALAGDPWVLGFEKRPNEYLARLLQGEVTLNDIRAERQPLVTPAQVLSDDPRVQEIVAKAVAATLAAIEAQRVAKKQKQMAHARGARTPAAAA